MFPAGDQRPALASRRSAETPAGIGAFAPHRAPPFVPRPRARTRPASTRRNARVQSIHQDGDGNCVFGKKEYWDGIYGDDNDGAEGEVAAADRLPAESHSWYCGWDELRPFWTMLVPDKRSRVLIAGIGNDPAPVEMYDDGWTNVTAYDYSRSGVDRARELFESCGKRRDGVRLMTTDARDLPLETSSVDATLDKGTLDAIYIAGYDAFRDSVREMGRVTAEGGVVVTVSRVIGSEILLSEFDSPLWENVHDGSLAFGPNGEASIDLEAELYSWKRTDATFE